MRPLGTHIRAPSWANQGGPVTTPRLISHVFALLTCPLLLIGQEGFSCNPLAPSRAWYAKLPFKLQLEICKVWQNCTVNRLERKEKPLIPSLERPGRSSFRPPETPAITSRAGRNSLSIWMQKTCGICKLTFRRFLPCPILTGMGEFAGVRFQSGRNGARECANSRVPNWGRSAI